jgi:hypothetical protein
VYERSYPVGSYSSVHPWRQNGLRLREYCQQAGISDRMPRPVIPGEKRALNKQIVEQLADQVYTLELENAPNQHIWAYRKAAWAIEDLEQDIRLIYSRMGLMGLRSIPNVSAQIAKEIEVLLKAG